MSAWVERRGDRYRVRSRIAGRIVTIGTYPTEGEASRIRDAYERRQRVSEVRRGLTLSVFGASVLAARAARGVRSIAQDRSRWSTYIDQDPLGQTVLRLLRRRDVIEWRDRLLRRGLAAQTVRNALHLLRSALADALDAELVAENAALTVRVPRSATTTTIEDLAGVLRPHEQQALLVAVPARFRAMVALALLTGLRWSELAHLRWEDVRDDVIVVRLSRGGLATKAGRPRLQPMLEATRAVLGGMPRTGELVLGGDRASGWRPRGWTSWVRAAGIERRVRWHDLRHTCATSLLAGWWGRRWSLEEVRGYLGHRSVTTTERYARLLDDTIALAVSETAAPNMLPGGDVGGDATSRIPAAPPARIELATNGLGNRRPAADGTHNLATLLPIGSTPANDVFAAGFVAGWDLGMWLGRAA